MSRHATYTAVFLIKPWKHTCVVAITSVTRFETQLMSCTYSFLLMSLIMLLGKIFVSVPCSSGTGSLVSMAASRFFVTPSICLERAMETFNQ